MASPDAALTAKGVLERGNELRAPEAAVVAARAEPEAVAQVKGREEPGEAARVGGGDPVVRRAAREIAWKTGR